jgi:hypothetical protein
MFIRHGWPLAACSPRAPPRPSSRPPPPTSRGATAYRYFPNQRTLLTAAYPHIDRPPLLPTPAPPDPAARPAAVVDAQTQLVLELEPEVRTPLRLALDPEALTVASCCWGGGGASRGSRSPGASARPAARG